MSSAKRLARIAGVLYLINAVFSFFAFGYVLGKVYVVGDAAKTAANVVANAGLVRAGVVADLFPGDRVALPGVGVLRAPEARPRHRR
ncbi:MAG: DUF4386 domain-containing protein [Candidatus Dormibacterales bacterium]